MQVIQAKPTKFGGVQYRSRLEATWAVLFDRLGIRFSYEDAKMANGTIHKFQGGYCPDFRLGVQQIDFVEVKPVVPNIEYVNKLRDAAIEIAYNGYHLILLVGSLRDGLPMVYEFPYHRPCANFGSWLMDVAGCRGREVSDAHRYAQNFRWDLYSE